MRVIIALEIALNETALLLCGGNATAAGMNKALLALRYIMYERKAVGNPPPTRPNREMMSMCF